MRHTQMCVVIAKSGKINLLPETKKTHQSLQKIQHQIAVFCQKMNLFKKNKKVPKTKQFEKFKNKNKKIAVL